VSRKLAASTANYLRAKSVPTEGKAPLTISVWFNPTAGTEGTVVGMGLQAGEINYHAFAMNGTGVFMETTNTNGSKQQDTFATGGALAAGAWGHMAVVAASSSSRTVYKNGGASATGTENLPLEGLNEITVGALMAGSLGVVSAAKGLIAEVAIWNVALTKAQIEELAAKKNPTKIEKAHLVGYWQLAGEASPEPSYKGEFGPSLEIVGAVTGEPGSNPGVESPEEAGKVVLPTLSAAGSSSASGALHTPISLPPITAAGTSSASGALHVPTTLPLLGAAGTSTASGSLSVPTGAHLPPLTAAGTSSTSAGLSVRPHLILTAEGTSTASGLLSVPSPPPSRRLERKPPLALDLEVENGDGDVVNLRSDSRKASNRPFGLGCGSERGEGFSTGNASFLRDIYRDHPDLNLMDTWRMVGREGSIAYEGELAGLPRSNSPAPTFTANLVGYMTYLKSRPVPMLIIDRRTGWVGPSNSRLANLLVLGYRMEGSMSTGWQFEGLGPGVVLTFSNFDAVYRETGEAALFAGGEDIGVLRFDARQLAGGGSTTDWEVLGALTTDDVWSVADVTANLTNANVPTVELSAKAPGRKFAMLFASYKGTFTGSTNEVLAALSPRIIGTHGLTPAGESPLEGYELTDIVEYMLTTYFPKVSLATGSPRNSFPVQQCTGHDKEIDGAETLQTLNNLILWETNIFEDRELHMEPADLTKVDWWIDTTWPGVTVNYQGETIEDLASGIEVFYEDFFGHTYRLRPDEHPELLDPNPNNPAYRRGEVRWIPKTVPWPCLEPEALQFGRAQLAENNRPRRPGSFTVAGGYVKDAAGHWQQGWKMRNSQTLGVKNHPDETEPRLIYAPRWDDESSTLTIAVDGLPQTLEAIVARRSMLAEARGLT
jgi:hypothetical protein